MHADVRLLGWISYIYFNKLQKIILAGGLQIPITFIKFGFAFFLPSLNLPPSIKIKASAVFELN